MHTTRRAIPRTKDGIAALRGEGAASRSGAPTWLAAAAIAGVAVQAVSSDAAADPGSVQLRNGGRVRGDLTAILPNDRVIVTLTDGTTLTVPWTEVQFVFEGTRVYDSAGNVGTLDAPAAPAPSTAVAPSAQAPSTSPGTQPSPAPSGGAVEPGTAAAMVGPSPRYGGQMIYGRPLQSDAAAWNEYSNLRRRGGGVALATFGSLFLAEGILNVTFGSLIGSYTGSYGGYSGGGPQVPMIAIGSLSMGVGALMIGFAVRSLHRRNKAIENLRGRGFLVAGLHDALSISFDADVASDRVIPRLTLRF